LHGRVIGMTVLGPRRRALDTKLNHRPRCRSARGERRYLSRLSRRRPPTHEAGTRV
jgi:hypothetical protein